MSLITTVTCNVAIDKIYHLERVQVGKLMRVEKATALPGGKGINVARVLRRLGQPVLATGFIAGFNGAWVRHRLDEEGIAHDFIEVEGETRLSITIPDPRGRGQTEILEPGPPITGQDEATLLGVVRQWARESRAVALCGSLPPGASPDLYARLVEAVQAEGVPVALDTSGEPLRLGLAARPFLVKPNRDEFQVLAGPLWGRRALWQAALEWSERSGTEWFIVTLGDEGALAVHRAKQPGTPGRWSGLAAGNSGDEPEIFWVAPLRVRPVNTLGSGDSFLGGFLAGWAAGRDPEGCLRLAAACAAANVMVMGPGAVEKEAVQNLEQKVEIERWT
ncbi:MAG: 1-phosphofructokinase family hexose kinase [Limnochordales bacterium]|nr:1-phosphofructokinase family hexose kinase [Limnochordales bacterium]